MRKLEWIKYDLHHHTNEDKDRSNSAFNYENILKKCSQEKIKLISITNHNIISPESFKEYKKIIQENNYDINILPGIELQFKMKNLDKKGHLIIIFDGEYDIDRLDLFFKRKENYDPDSINFFEDEFKKLLSNLIKDENAFYNFIISIHFDKSSNVIDYDSIYSGNDKKDFIRWINSFDIFEGKKANIESIKIIKESLEKAGANTDKTMISGTDSHNDIDFFENIKKIPWILSEPSFNGLKKVILYPKTRIWEKSLQEENVDEPLLIEKYIEEIQIGNENIKLSQGLNTIIGRRGSGKSYLLNSIIKKIDPSISDFQGLTTTDDINLIGHIDKNEVLIFKQSELSENLNSFVLEIATEKQRNFSLIKYIFGNSWERKDFTNPLIDLKNKKNKIKENIKNLILLEYEIIKNKSKKNVENYEIQIYKNTLNYIEENTYKNILKKIKIDFEILNNIIPNKESSKWLENEISKLKKRLTFIGGKFRHHRFEEIKKLENDINTLIFGKKFDTNESKIINKKENLIEEIKNNNLKNSINEFKNFINKMVVFYKNVKKEKEIFNDNELVNENIPFLTFETRIKFTDDNLTLKDFVNYLLQTNLNIDNGFSKKVNSKSDDSINEIIKFLTIPKINNESIFESSMGQKHEKFMEAILEINNKEIIILDQPDDDLDSLTIEETLLKRFRENYYNKQWIVITHDPKIVINSDSRNIILANYSNASSKENFTYKNINQEKEINMIYEIIDAKKEYPKIRGNIYEK